MGFELLSDFAKAKKLNIDLKSINKTRLNTVSTELPLVFFTVSFIGPLSFVELTVVMEAQQGFFSRSSFIFCSWL